MADNTIECLRKKSVTDLKKLNKDVLINAIMANNGGDDVIASEIRALREAQEANTIEIRAMRQSQDANSQKLDVFIAKLNVMEADIRQLREENIEVREKLENAIAPKLSTENDDVTVIMAGLKEDKPETEEALLTKVAQVVASLGDSCAGLDVIEAKRMKSHQSTKPGLVKVAFGCKEDKIKVLKEKKELLKTPFKEVKIRASQSPQERIASQNFRALLRTMPGGEQYYVNANGRVLQKSRIERESRSDDNAGPGA